MSNKSKKVRVVSLKEAADINKKNVAFFTLTDGSVAVIKKDEKGLSQNNNLQKEEFSKYKRNFATNNNYNQSYKQESKNAPKSIKVEKESNAETSNYKLRNYNKQEKEDNKGQKNYEKNSDNSQTKGYSFKGQIYGNQNNQESSKERFSYRKKYQKGQNEVNSSAEGYSYKGEVYGNQSEKNESSSQDKGYSFKGQVYTSQNILNDKEANKDKVYFSKGQVYEEQNNQKNQEGNEDKGKLRYKRKYESEQNNNYNDSSKGYSYKGHVYSNSNQNSNINLNDDSTTLRKNQFKKYQNQSQSQYIKNRDNIEETNKPNYNNFNNSINNSNFSNKYQSKNLRGANDSSQNSQNQYLNQYKNQNKSEYLSGQSYTQQMRNINEYPQQISNKSKNYELQVIEAIPVKLVDNYNSQMRNYSYPKPQYVEPYLNPEIIVTGIKLGKSGGKFGYQSNIDYARRCNTNYFNQFNKQITDSFHDFDNLLNNDDQRDFRNDPFYRNVDLKYSELSVEPRNDILRSYNKQIKKYERPFSNVNSEIKNSNDRNGNRLSRQQNSEINNHKLKVSNGT